jgi:N-acetylmuramoyl-L-alanine amidase
VSEISEETEGERGSELNRTSMRAAQLARRHRARNNILIAGGIVLMGCVAAVIILALMLNGGGPHVPGVIGMKYEDAKKRIKEAGFFIEIDPMQDSSGDCRKLSVEMQDPKPGSGAEKNETVTVRLAGLHESAEFTGQTEKRGPAPGDSQAAGQPAPQQAAGDTTPAQPEAAGRVICIDPGHSGRDGSETDPATGLNVGDNGGCAGELQSMWDLAQKTRAKLEAAGYSVRLTKDGPDAYASLRARADTGNSCALVIRLHYDDTGYTGVLRAPANAARCPTSDPSRITVIDGGVAGASDTLARSLAGPLGLSVKDDTGGTSQGNGTPSGHPTGLIGSVLSRVPVVCIENKMDLVRNNASGQDEVASQIAAGVNAYFQPR